MNDASPRFAEGQAGAHHCHRAKRAISAWPNSLSTRRAERMGYRGRVARRDGRRALRRILPTIVGDGRRHYACIRVDQTLHPPMDWLRLHMATRIKIGA